MDSRVRVGAGQTTWIGRSAPRREDDRFVTGQGTYVDDIRAAGALHAVFVRSAFARGRILRLDLGPVRGTPGVVAAFSAEDLGNLGESMVNGLVDMLDPRPMPFLAAEHVQAVGQPVAVVVARSADIAADAAELAILDVGEDDGSRGAATAVAHRWAAGDAAGAFGETAQTVAAAVDHALVAPMALEPRSVVAAADDGRLTVWLSTQVPFRVRTDLSRILGLPQEAIRVVAPDVGGAFGGKSSLYPDEALVAWAALQLDATVRWRASRSEEFMAGSHGRGASGRARAVLTQEGVLQALEADLRFTLGHWMPYSAAVPARNAGRILPGPYRVGAVDISVSAVPTPHAPVGIYRGAGRPEAAMLMERLMDEAAHALSLDPLELRRRNLLTRNALPFETPTGEILDSGCFHELLDRLEQAGEYAALRREQDARRREGGIVGMGVALYVEPCGRGSESAEISLADDGGIELVTGSTAQGQGRETTFAQIVADALGVPPAQVRVRQGDTGQSAFGVGALASRSTAIGGSAVRKACAAFIEKLRPVAAECLQAPLPRVHFGDGGAWSDGAGGAWTDWRGLAERLAKSRAPDERGLLLKASVTYEAAGEAWSSGACLAFLSIDADTGETAIERLFWVDDAGLVVNPMLVEGQLTGGMAQGFGEAMMERIVYDAEGQLLTGSLMDYAVPRAGDVPNLRTERLETPSPMNELGAKGVGEAGCIGIPAAIANAVRDALRPLGVQDVQMPFTSSRIWQAINDAKQAQGTKSV